MLSPNALKELQINFIVDYVRRSRQDEEMEKRTGEDTLKAQIDLMDRVLIPLGIPYDIKPEIGSGDKISTRPIFQSVIEDLKAGKYQAIAVKEISRMGRGSYTDMGLIYDLLRESRIYIITPYKVYDPNNPADARQIRFELFMSREEFETTRERLTGGRYNSSLAGKWVAGKPPFGYAINKNTKKLEIHEEDSQIVRIIFDLFNNGIPDGAGKLINMRYRALATYLHRNGFRTPNGKVEWRPDNLKYLLTNEVYIGTLRYRTTETINNKAVKRPEIEHVVVHNAHEPIIDLDVWERTQAKVNDYSYNPHLKIDFNPFELTGLPICLKCGRKMIRQEQNQKYKAAKSGEETVYHKEFLVCSTSSCTMVKYRPVEHSLLKALHQYILMDDEQLEIALRSHLGKESPTSKSNDDLEQYVDRRKKELLERMKFVYEKYETGKYDDKVFDERRAEVELELEKLKVMIGTSETPSQSNTIVIDPEKVRVNVSSLLNNYNNSVDRSLKNQILRSVFESVTIEVVEKGRGSIPAKFNIYPELKLDFIRVSSLN